MISYDEAFLNNFRYRVSCMYSLMWRGHTQALAAKVIREEINFVFQCYEDMTSPKDCADLLVINIVKT